MRDKGTLTPDECKHIAECDLCHDWLLRFSAMARRAGFEIAYEIPPKNPSTKKNGTDG